MAGGTDLFVQRGEALEDADMTFLSERDLARTWSESGRRYLGAAVPMEDLRALPPFADCLPCVASLPVRNRATVGGNIVNASPIGDFTIMLLALGRHAWASRGPRGLLRELPLEEFFLGLQAAGPERGRGRGVGGLPRAPADRLFHFEKVGQAPAPGHRRRELGRLSCACAAGGSARRAWPPAGWRPCRCCCAGRRRPWSAQASDGAGLRETLGLAQEEAAPISDVRGSADYKRRLLKHLLVAHFLALLPRRVPAERPGLADAERAHGRPA